ncbi:hypothetical protein, partial [Citricoccus sp. CH26A]|uniref:hypothetical protein n=1 Tax=Citricoccus sp. CH26A TaxID=1045009 RepID=UPI001ED974C2
MEHIGPFGIGLGWTLTDANGSLTLDAGWGFDRVDVRIHCRNSVIRVVDDSDSIPGTAPIHVTMSLAHGDVTSVGSFRDHFRILGQAQDVYDTVWRQFRPYNRSSRGAFPLGRKRTGLMRTFAESPTCEAAFPDKFPIAHLSFVEAAGVLNTLMPILHIKQDPRLFGTASSDRSLIPHEIGHVFHFAALRSSERLRMESSYLAYLTTAAATGQPLTHAFE